MRLFVAVELPLSLRQRLGAVQDAMRSAPLEVRWVRPEGIHLTLKFLGETEDARLAVIAAALGGAGRDLAPFRLMAGGAVPFPDRGTPRLIWTEIEGDLESVRRLAAAIDRAMASLGFPPEGREFKAHLTLGRVRGRSRGDWRATLQKTGELARGEFEVREYVLFQSLLSPGGSVYTPLQRFPLEARAA
ncbi:MAG TPA: RNA 2',3'-cyclic phosphodiesterase [Candidatus Polarisedimenticolia bacterium]|nr:RNA 2',3'-cyclic phosphodiesterase [Candidatus Polarisedimenticolia bacterium]